jgi:hypothetical protein
MLRRKWTMRMRMRRKRRRTITAVKKAETHEQQGTALPPPIVDRHGKIPQEECRGSLGTDELKQKPQNTHVGMG